MIVFFLTLKIYFDTKNQNNRRTWFILNIDVNFEKSFKEMDNA